MKKLINTLQKMETWFLMVCLALMGIVLAAQVILRYVFHSPLSWAEECARYLQIWITFIGMGYGARKHAHISLSLLRKRLPRTCKYLSMLVCDTAILIAGAWLLSISPEFLAQQNKLSSAMHIPMQLVYIVIPIGFSAYMIYILMGMAQYSIEFWQSRRAHK